MRPLGWNGPRRDVALTGVRTSIAAEDDRPHQSPYQLAVELDGFNRGDTTGSETGRS